MGEMQQQINTQTHNLHPERNNFFMPVCDFFSLLFLLIYPILLFFLLQ